MPAGGAAIDLGSLPHVPLDADQYTVSLVLDMYALLLVRLSESLANVPAILGRWVPPRMEATNSPTSKNKLRASPLVSITRRAGVGWTKGDMEIG